MKNNKKKKVIYWITSNVALFVLGFGIIMGTNILTNTQNSKYKMADIVVDRKQDEQTKEESLTIDLQVNKLETIGEKRLDADIETIGAEDLPKELKFMENILLPQEFKLLDKYKIYVRSNVNIRKYDVLHDYVFAYKREKEHEIRVALSTVAEPLRDYYLGETHKISKIGEVALKIAQYEEMYMATFKINTIYFDIETNGITENELIELLKSIIMETTM